MPQDLGNLGVAPEATYPRHAPYQIARFRDPGRGGEFAESTIEGHLDLQPPKRRCFIEHLALDLAGLIPGGLAACRGVQSEH
jgi:hypothetical protein